MYDVIVIGAGHNGLTCAAFLARGGRRVLVLESREIVGGMCTTEETVPEAPGFKMNPCAVDTALTNAPVSVIDELELHKYGLRFVHPDPWAAFIGPDDEAIGLWKDRNRTREEIAKYSKKDAAAFENFCATMTDAWWALLPYFQDHPTRPSPKTVGQMLWRLGKGRKSLRYAAHVFMSSPEQVLEEHFEHDAVKAVFANLGAWSMLPLEEPGSGGVLAMMVSYFGWGVTRPVGGSGEFTGALARCVEAHGGEIRVNSRVDEIMVREDEVRGVRLDNGEELHARHVIGAIDPYSLMGKMVPQEHVPEKTKGELRAFGSLRWNISALKADVAIERMPTLKCGRPELAEGYLLLGPTVDYIRQAQRQSMVGDLPTAVPMGPMFPSLLDRTQVPPGSDGETIYLYMQSVPLELNGGRTWSGEKDNYIKYVISEMDKYMPGLEDTVIGCYVKSPEDLATKSGAHRGNLVHADMSLNQMGPYRPMPSMSGYKTPIKRLWHTAAGAHPMGALNGWSGRTTGKMVDKLISKDKDHIPGSTSFPISDTSNGSTPTSSSSEQVTTG